MNLSEVCDALFANQTKKKNTVGMQKIFEIHT
jgi:hypothetical protein